MNTKRTLRRIVGAGHTVRASWATSPLAVMREAMQAVLDGAPAPSIDAVRAAVAAAYTRRGVTVAPDDVRWGIDATRLIAAASADTIVALMDPGGLETLAVHIGDGRGAEWDRGFYRGIEYLSSCDELGYRIPLPMHEPKLAQIAAAQGVTGVAMTVREMLQWVRYAQQTGMTIIHDATAGDFVTKAPASLLAVEGAASCVLETVSLAPCGLAGAVYSVIPAAWQADIDKVRDVPLAEALGRYLVEPELSPVLAAGVVARYSARGEAEWAERRQALCEVMARVRELLDTFGSEYWGGAEIPVIWTDKRSATAVAAAYPAAVLHDGADFGPAGTGRVRVDLSGVVRSTKGEE